jgi:hypothetical protein
LNFFSLLGFLQDGKDGKGFGLLHLAVVNPRVEHKSTTVSTTLDTPELEAQQNGVRGV